MRKCRPSKWVPWAFAGAGLPLLAAAVISTAGMKSGVVETAKASLAGSDLTKWATVEMDGRIATITGKTTNPAAIDEVAKIVAGTYGVRQVVNQSAAEPLALVAPTVSPVMADAPIDTITGTWPEGVAKTLNVKVADTTYTLPGSPELTSSSGNWLLKLPQALPAGAYDVTATASVDSDGATVAQSTPAPVQVVVKEAAPEPEPEPEPAPVVAFSAPVIAPVVAGAAWPYAISGQFPEAVTERFSATVDGREYVLGRGSALTSDGNGNFTFQPSRQFAPGSYDVEFSVTGKGGESAKTTSAAAIVVPAPPEPEPAPEPEPEPAPVVAFSAPVIAPVVAGAAWPYAISGQFPEAVTERFSAMVDGREYVLGRGSALTSDGNGNFTFQPSRQFAPGSYDVEFSVTGKGGESAKTTSAAAIVVPAPPEPVAVADTTPPAAPAVVAVAADTTDSRTVTGTWPEGDAKSLSATLEGRTYILDRGNALTRTADAPGTFTFAPNTARLAPGKYTVEFATTDAAGNVAKAIAENAIIIPEPPKVAEPAPAPAPEATPAPAVEPVTLALPTVDKQLDLTGAPIIRGTWPEGEGTSLSIGLNGKTYDLGTSANLARDGAGKWKLLPTAALKDGIYDVVVTARNGDVEVKDGTLAEVEVDATLPTAATVTAYASDVAPTALTGTYDAKRSTALKVAVPELNLMAELGAAASPLTVDGEGNWTLALPQPAAPGTYNVVVTSTDKRGRSVDDSSAGEMIISAKDQPAPKVDAKFDCAAVMNRISSVFPMRFIYAQTDFQERFGLSVSQYSALLKDSRCNTLQIEVGGHADERGSLKYNEDLAERRAAKVRDMLVEAGVETSRLSVATYGESKPLDTSATEEAWSKNRRVEIKIVK